MKIYVKVSDTDKPYLSGASTEALDGYTSIEGLTNDQAIATLSRPNKCYMDDNGVLIVPNQIPLSQSEKDAENVKIQLTDMNKKLVDMQTTITTLNTDKSNLQTALNNANTDNANLKAQIQSMQKQSLAYMTQLAQINAELAKYKQSQSSTQGGDK
ncbi:hypothetical protein AKUH4B202J_08500 [Apilactobacillus kunkeei]|nr:hypothetical protein AKUH4B202J_08500 [Apilactobacillus kunkeei]CAI2611491.1 hypothetical protein AKUH4B204J_08760 [Apilactobacillus kunkeei]